MATMEDVKVVKSENFAIRIVNLYKFLTVDKKELVISKQILRSGTSIGANIAESTCAESDSDFVHKLAIALKECAETKFWLKILFRTEYISPDIFRSMYNECDELYRIITSIINKMKCK